MSIGPQLDMSKYRSCLIPDTDYLFSARVRLTRPDGHTTRCRARGTDCLRVSTLASNEWDQHKWYLKEPMRPALAPPDGEWFDLTLLVKFEPREANPDATFEVLYISGPEAGVDIDIDDIRLELPPESGYPDGDLPEDMCKELFPGQAVEGSMHPFPLTTNRLNDRGNTYTPLLVKSDDLGTYYSVIGRWENWVSLTFPVVSQCAAKGSGYAVSATVRLHSGNPVDNAYMEMNILGLVNGHMRTVKVLRIADCPSLGGDLGWIVCEGSVSFDEDYSDKEIQWRLNTGSERNADVDYRDISMTPTEGSIQSIILDKSIEDCWGKGSRILITSNTAEDTHQVAQIEEITGNIDGQSVTVLLKDVIAPTTTLSKDSKMAVEVALLDRNVVIKGDKDDHSYRGLHGGYMSVFYTPQVNQLIQGVLFEHMGQQGLKDRFVSCFFK